MRWEKGSLTYHCLDGVTLRSGDGYTGTAVGGIVPSLEGEGRAEEVAWEGVSGERASSAADVAAVEGGLTGESTGGSGRGRFVGSRYGGSGGSSRAGGSAGNLNGSLSGGSAGDFDGSLGLSGCLRGGGGLHGWGSNGLNDSGSLG